jgi:hypothetical protein
MNPRNLDLKRSASSTCSNVIPLNHVSSFNINKASNCGFVYEWRICKNVQEYSSGLNDPRKSKKNLGYPTSKPEFWTQDLPVLKHEGHHSFAKLCQ